MEFPLFRVSTVFLKNVFALFLFFLSINMVLESIAMIPEAGTNLMDDFDVPIRGVLHGKFDIIPISSMD